MEPQLFLLPERQPKADRQANQDPRGRSTKKHGPRSASVTRARPVSSRIDERTKRIGRKGIAQARAALQKAAARSPQSPAA